MSSARFQKISTIFFWLSACICLLWIIASHFLAGTGYFLVSQLSSPNGKLTIHEFLSNDDSTGHAPYGQNLVLSRHSNLRNPENGHVIFAGYCKRPLQYEWVGDQEVIIRCTRKSSKDATKTLASLAVGIKVSYFEQ
jgi:hypothetical protein